MVQQQHVITSQNKVLNPNHSTMMNNNANVFNNCFVSEAPLNNNGKNSCPNGENENSCHGKLYA
jgi:hypothetical protein